MTDRKNSDFNLVKIPSSMASLVANIRARRDVNDRSSVAESEDSDDRRPNIAMPTLGGKVFWGDNFIYAGWRIQENVVTGHHRLLDPGDVRQAWGTYAQCLAVLSEIRSEQNIAPRRASSGSVAARSRTLQGFVRRCAREAARSRI